VTPHNRKVVFSSKNQEMGTPRDLFKLLTLKDGPFVLDAAASKVNALCEKFYTKKENGLVLPWAGAVWNNPPYGRGIEKWTQKAIDETMPGGACERVVMLLPSRTSRKFFQDHVWNFADEVRFLRGRLRFVGQKWDAPFPSIVVVFKRRDTTNRNAPRMWCWDWKTEYKFRFEPPPGD
jgi:site-specific DNA-methyltransferase (adenine-specific)